MNRDWQVRASTVYGITLLVTLLGFMIPVGIQFVAPFIGFFYYLRLKKLNRIKRAGVSEILLILLYTVVGIGGFVYLTGYALATTPWWKIILIGMAADVVASVLGTIPVVGDIISATINFIMAFTIIGGIQGPFIGVALAIIALLPGPSIAASTIFIVIFKIVSVLIFGM